jgi:hypothetical protein
LITFLKKKKDTLKRLKSLQETIFISNKKVKEIE